jgi:hypothetical protein
MVSFPYFKYRSSDGTYSSLPMIPIRVACNRKHQWVMALVDSGADITLFNASIAKLLDISVKQGKEIPLFGFLENETTPVYMHQVNLAVENLGSVDTNVAFTCDETYPQLSILGRRGFFEKFRVEFEYNQRIKIYPPK